MLPSLSKSLFQQIMQECISHEENDAAKIWKGREKNTSLKPAIASQKALWQTAATFYQLMTATMAPSVWVLSRPSELYSEERANLGVRIFAILTIMQINFDFVWIELAWNLILLQVIRVRSSFKFLL